MILAKFSFSPNGKCPTSLNDKLLERNYAPNHSVELQIGGHFQRRRIWFVYVFPRKHTTSKEKSVLGSKSKLRFTGMAAASATREKLPMFVIGKSKKPRYFQNIKHLPCQYTSQKKSWMDSEIFENWVRKLDQKFRVDGRKIVLIIDNCPAHPSISNLTNIHLVFLPPNTTSVL